MEQNRPMQDGVVENPPKYKVVILGDTFVGKSCLIQRFVYNTFSENYEVI